MKKWTIAFVNYKTSVYMRWQFKIMYEFNNPEDFEIIIVDNSRPSEKDILEKITAKYNKEYNNIKIIYHTPKAESASGQHGEGINIAIKEANSKYFLMQDPDFFFTKPYYLDFLAAFLDKGLVAVGAPYRRGVGLGHPNFPALYGAAHPLDLIKNIDCGALDSKEYLVKSHVLYKEQEYSYDVGHRIREELSTEDNDNNFLSFAGEYDKTLENKLGKHSYEVHTQRYTHNNEEIAYHLVRGSFTSEVDGIKDVNKELSKYLLKIRNNYGEYFYSLIKQAQQSKK